ncbi:MAG: glycosyltransferase [Ardenticatenaceae bacterium]|nr:glycosyltransferase [Ardenticatenaceae bacterium]MCB9443750.1 glycosyltransferase [Ardenticatenaceae bacterium]
MRKRILFLMSDTGGGHRASAQAICEAIGFLYPDQFEILIEDIWMDHTRWPFNQLPHLYPWLSSSGTRWWMVLWRVTQRPFLWKSIMRMTDWVTRRGILRFLREVQPDIVVSVHPAMNHLGVEWVKQICPGVPFYTVITDMVTVHPTWVCPEVTGCAVSTQPAREQAIAAGMPAEKVAVCGQPVGLKFAHLNGERPVLRARLDLDGERPCILIVGGGEGIGRVYDIARSVAQTVEQAQLIIVAGRNKHLKQKLEAIIWEIPTQVYGFVQNMSELMGAADILVTKAGPGTISEAFIAGLPIIISGYIPGQERGNVDYVLENNAGAYAEEPVEIARLINDWLHPQNDLLEQMKQNAARLARPQASLEIARLLCGHV